jgi:hypothetical protein
MIDDFLALNELTQFPMIVAIVAERILWCLVVSM